MSTLRALAVGALLAQPVGAGDLYKYTDPQTGRVVIGNQPPPAGAKVAVDMQRPQTPPMVYSPPPAAPTPPRTPSPAMDVLERHVTQLEALGQLASQQPVTRGLDTTQLALARGKTKGEIRAAYGPPLAQDFKSVWIGRRLVMQEWWMYPPYSAGVGGAALVFVDDVVEASHRLR